MGLDALGGLEGMDGQGPSPQQLAQMLQAMPEPQRNQVCGWVAQSEAEAERIVVVVKCCCA
jgi:hypothetical protein